MIRGSLHAVIHSRRADVSGLQRAEDEALVEALGDEHRSTSLLAEAVSARHKVYSFDHVAINERVTACDLAKVPLEDEDLDLAIFCLALMGTNFTDYVREVHRCLPLDGRIHIWEPASYFDDVDAFCGALGQLGFEMVSPRHEGPFVRITAVKSTTKPAPSVVLPFRGHVVPSTKQ